MKKNLRQKGIITHWIALILLSILVWTTCWLFHRAFAMGEQEGLITTSIVVQADENSKTEKEVEEELYEIIGGQLEALDLKELEEYVNSLEGALGDNLGERLMAYIKGEKFDYRQFGSQILEVLFAKVIELLPFFACIAAITLLSGILSTLQSGSSNAASNMVFLISYAAMLIPVIGVLTECIQQTFSCVESMQRQMQLIYPLMLTLMAASGGTLSAAICRPAVSFFSTAIISVITSVVFPFTIAIIAFSMAGNLTKELKISKFTDFFKSTNKWIIGICVSVFGIFFTLQGITASTYDGIVRRAAKYAIGNGVPIVGGFLSGGFDLVVAGGVLIKNSLGSLGIFLMVSILFEPLILLISVNLLLRLTAAVTQPFGDSKISDFLGETAGNLHYCTAGLLFAAFLYFLSIVLMICSSEALF